MNEVFWFACAVYLRTYFDPIKWRYNVWFITFLEEFHEYVVLANNRCSM